jgi:hypothetical protein
MMIHVRPSTIRLNAPHADLSFRLSPEVLGSLDKTKFGLVASHCHIRAFRVTSAPNSPSSG